MGGLRPCLFAYFRGGWGVQNLEKPAYIILERSLSMTFDTGLLNACIILDTSLPNTAIILDTGCQILV